MTIRILHASILLIILAISLIFSTSFGNAASLSPYQNNSKQLNIIPLNVKSNISTSNITSNSSANLNQSHVSGRPTAKLNPENGPKDVIGMGNSTANPTSNKLVMINFDDGYKSQLIYAKPILDRYGFKASFFIVCGRVGTQPYWLNWQDVAQLKKDGMDIESHTMTHAHLNTLAKKTKPTVL